MNIVSLMMKIVTDDDDDDFFYPCIYNLCDFTKNNK